MAYFGTEKHEIKFRSFGLVSNMTIRFWFKLIGVLAILVLTNPDVLNNLPTLLARKQFGTLIPFVGIWVVTILALATISFHPRLVARVFWGLIVAGSTSLIWGYYQASHSQMSVLDAISFWNARHEAGRAADFYNQHILHAKILFAALFIFFIAPVPAFGPNIRRSLVWATALPIIPMLMIGAVFWFKNGVTYMTMPSQFSAVPIASLVAYKQATQTSVIRHDVSWKPVAKSPTRNIIFMVDESVRSEYIDLKPNNPYTPKFAALADKFVNFGPAASGGNCSNYANGLLRFGASREDIVGSTASNPTLFQYAKKAGFRTVFIDAQAGSFALGNMLQNFMTLKEKSNIDGFYLIRNVKADMADRELINIVAKELQSSQPVFIYANKNGSHFPYDHAYPSSEAKFHPTMTETGIDTQAARIASYRNAIAWSVDDFMKIFFGTADLSSTTMVYTSDHGQMLQAGKLTHCMVDNPDPRTGIVPLMVYSSDPATRARLETGAKLSVGKASHFQIAPTLYELMGYSRTDIAKNYDESLFDGTTHKPEMTTGDVFGVFGAQPNETLIPLTENLLETDPTQFTKTSQSETKVIQ